MSINNWMININLDRFIIINEYLDGKFISIIKTYYLDWVIWNCVLNWIILAKAISQIEKITNI